MQAVADLHSCKIWKKYKLDANKQVDLLRYYLTAYNGDNPDYEYIDQVLFDSGAGG